MYSNQSGPLGQALRDVTPHPEQSRAVPKIAAVHSIVFWRARNSLYGALESLGVPDELHGVILHPQTAKALFTCSIAQKFIDSGLCLMF